MRHLPLALSLFLSPSLSLSLSLSFVLSFFLSLSGVVVRVKEVFGVERVFTKRIKAAKKSRGPSFYPLKVFKVSISALFFMI